MARLRESLGEVCREACLPLGVYEKEKIMRRMGRIGRVLAVAIAGGALVATTVPSVPAFAYFNFGTVSVAPGASSLSVVAGGTASTNVSVSPSSHAQTQGCGMAQCPQVCNGDGAIEAGYSCFDANGQCTCAGTAYTTYTPNVSCVSSNAGVASAYMSGNTLVVTGRSAGTATISISASLRQWSTGSAYVTVNVSAPQQSSGNQQSGGGQQSSGAQGDSLSSSGGTVKASSSGIPEAAKATESKSDELNEQTVESEGGTVVIVENNSHLNTAEELKKIAGKENAQLVIWSGASSDQPDYSWTFRGEDVSADDPNLDFDPTIKVSEQGEGTAANLTKQAKDSRVLDFAYKGKLPAKASIYVKAGSKYPDETTLSLFSYNGKNRVFAKAQDDGCKVSNGYFSFETDEGATFAVSTDDLASYKVRQENTPEAAKKQKAAEDKAVQTASSSKTLIYGAAAVVVAAVVAVAAVVLRRKKSAGAKVDPKDVSAQSDEANEATDEAADEATDEATDELNESEKGSSNDE